MRIKLTVIVLIGVLLKVSAADGYAQTVTLRERNATLRQVFEQVKQQTGYTVFYRSEDLVQSKPVTVSLFEASLQNALDAILKGQNLEYVIDEHTIVIKERTAGSFFKNLLGKGEADTGNPQMIAQGRVVDQHGQPLSGATIRIKGTNTAVLTDKDGRFAFRNLASNTVLVISYVGYIERELQASGDMGLITMSVEEGELDEINVISTGYQRIEKSQMTGAASVMGEEQYQQRTAVTGNFLENLEGKIPGLVYNAQSGELTIRGVSTFDAVKQPLIVLDGFPTEIDLLTINPNDIVSVSVLRDAAATSIYGVRASNGVIVIETRRGKSGKSVASLRSSLAIQAAPDFDYLQYASASEFVQLQKDQFYKATPAKLLYDLGYFKMNPAQKILFQGPLADVANPALNQAQVDEQLIALGSYDNLAEYERLFYQRRQAKNINFDLSGGNDVSTYMVGVNYIGETPVNRGSDNKQININLANTIKFSDRFNFDFKGTYTTIQNQSGTTPGYTEFFPYERLTDDQGNALPVTLGPGRNGQTTFMTTATNQVLMDAGLYDMFYYPYRELSGTTNTYSASAARLQGRMNSRITDWMNLDLGGNYELQNSTNDQLQTPDAIALRRLINSMALRDANTGMAVFTNLPQGNILKKDIRKLSNYTLRGQLNFNHTFANSGHQIGGMLGVEQKRTYSQGFTTSFFGYDGQTLIVQPVNMSVLNATTSAAFTFSPLAGIARFNSSDYFGESAADRRFLSYYGQGTYILKSKYLATGSFRIDQSNLFGINPKYRNKPLWSAGINWRLSEEEFLKELGWVSNIQLRASTGFNGNVPTSNNGAFLILTNALNTTFAIPLQYNEILTPENQSLRWETTRSHNFGIDYSFFGHLISGSVDYYIKRSTDVFGLFDSDPTTGFNQYNANTASIENKGLELLVNTPLIKHTEFGWNLQFTSSFNHNKVLAVKATEFSASVQYVNAAYPVVGRPLSSLFSYDFGGLNASGQPFVYDRDGNEKVIAVTGTGPGVGDVTKSDLLYSGTTTPKYVLGLNNQFRLGTFDVSLLWMYYGGHVMRVEQPNPYSLNELSHPLRGSMNFWKEAGDEIHTSIPGFVSASNTPGYFTSQALYGYRYADRYVRRADYIRLRDIIVTYRVQAGFLDRVGLRNTQLQLQAQNPFRYTFSGNDIDPDAINRINGIRRLETQPLYSLTLFTNF